MDLRGSISLDTIFGTRAINTPVITFCIIAREFITIPPKYAGAPYSLSGEREA